MKTRYALIAMSVVALVGCKDAKKDSDVPPPPPQLKGKPPAQATPPPSAQGAASQPAAAGGAVTGKVVETMNSGGYTYVHVDAPGQGKVWAAGPTTAVKVGDTVRFGGGMVMQGFKSNTLDRTFDKILFVQAIEVQSGGAAGGEAVPEAHKKAAAEAPKVEVGKVEKLDGGMTVAEVFAKAKDLTGKKVRLRAKVVKYNGGIMGKNWLHVQDGSGAAGSDDLTVTTDGTAEVGDVVVLEGTLATNKDFGAGYSYPVILEGATVTK